jgi:hypothetical protein
MLTVRSGQRMRAGSTQSSKQDQFPPTKAEPDELVEAGSSRPSRCYLAALAPLGLHAAAKAANGSPA